MAGTRQRIIGATAVLMRRQGYEATGMKEIVTAASAPFGSVYHFFPGGKEQLGAETIQWSGAEYAKLLAAALDSSPDLAGGVRAFFEGAAEHLVATGYADACPIATIALEVSSHSEVLRQACAAVFEMWIGDGARRLAAGGVPHGAARRLAIEMLAMLEGAFVLCRAARDTEALAVAADAALASLSAALAPGAPAPGGHGPDAAPAGRQQQRG
jgi:AcrR family transcriptional regulator